MLVGAAGRSLCGAKGLRRRPELGGGTCHLWLLALVVQAASEGASADLGRNRRVFAGWPGPASARDACQSGDATPASSSGAVCGVARQGEALRILRGRELDMTHMLDPNTNGPLDEPAAVARRAAWLELTRDAVIVRDLRDRIVYWNRGAEQQYGWSRAEAIGRVTHELLDTVFPEPLETIRSKRQ